jgi:hypothetical protein
MFNSADPHLESTWFQALNLLRLGRNLPTNQGAALVANKKMKGRIEVVPQISFHP